MTFDYQGRVARLQALMSDAGVDAVVLSVGADLPYFTGYEAMPSERLTALVVPLEGAPKLYIPALEAPRVEPLGFDVHPWQETEDPVMAATAGMSPHRVAVGDHMWSVFLTRFQNRWSSEWIPASQLTTKLRMRKDPEEIERLRRAAEAVDRVMSRIPEEVRFLGRSELDVSRDLQAMTVEEGHEMAEHAIVGAGENGASPHHHASQRIIETGDMVVCDFGGRWGGYFSDSTRTFVVGDPSRKQAEAHEVVEASNEAGRRAAVPGATCQDVDRAAREVIDDSGLGEFFIHRTGHGIGLEVHEHPYMVEGNQEVLEEGMAFSVEPGVYLPGEFGIRIEDICVAGVGSLNQSSRNLTIVD